MLIIHPAKLCLFSFVKSNIPIMIFPFIFFLNIIMNTWCGPLLLFQIHVVLNCISLLYLIIIQNDRWPQGAMSYNCSAVSINHKQSTFPFGVHIQIKVNLNGSYVNKVMGNSAHKVCSPKYSLPGASSQFDICNRSYVIPFMLNEMNYNVLKQLHKDLFTIQPTEEFAMTSVFTQVHISAPF